MKNLKIVFLLLISITLFSCGDSDNDSDDIRTLESIAITVADTSIYVADQQQVTATGTYSDNTTDDITDDVTWSSSSTSKATISSSGLLTGAAGGTSIIKATKNSITSNSKTVTVKPIYVYGVDVSSNSVKRCLIKSNYTLTSCVDSGATVLNQPLSLTFNNAKTFAYILNNATTSVTKCAVDADTGLLSACATSGPTTFDNPRNVVINDSDTFAYVGRENDPLNLCEIDSMGDLNNCIDSGAVLADSSHIILNEAGTFMYSVSGATDIVSICTVSQVDGTLSACASAGATTLNFALSGTINPAGTVMYFPNTTVSTVSTCNIHATTGMLSSCVSTTSTADNPTYIDFTPSGNQAYINGTGNNRINTTSVEDDDTLKTAVSNANAGSFVGLVSLKVLAF